MTRLCYILIICCCFTGKTAFSQSLDSLGIKAKVKNFFKDFKKADPFKISGSIGLNMRSYNAINTENRQATFIWNLNGGLNMSIYKIRIPISILISSQNTTVSHPFHQQTLDNLLDRRFTRIGASPYYKWMKLHIGHRNMNFSPFTVANHTFLGAGLELTPGKIRLATFYGGMAKAEPRDQSLLGLNTEIFNRKGFGIKAGYGSNQNFIDFIFFTAKDKPSELDPINLDTTTIFQHENAVLGINGQTTLFKKFTFKLELVTSGFTKNAADPKSGSSQFPITAFMLTPRSSTNYRNAMNSSLNYQVGILTIGAGYKRIEPEFRSLGAYFFNNDLEDYTLNLGFSLLKNRLRVNATGGLQKNNLFGDKVNQLSRTIGSLNLNYSLNKLNIALNYSNFSSSVDFVLNPDLDSLNAVIITQNTSINTSYTLLSKKGNRHLFSANFAIQQVTDDVENQNRSAASQMINTVLNYSYSPKASRWKINTRINYNQNELRKMLIKRYGLGIGLQRKLVKDIWSLAINTNYFYSDGESNDNQTLNLRLNSPFRINKHHRIDFSILYLNRFKASNNSNGNFQEITGILNYVYSF